MTVLSLTWESPHLGKMVFILRWGPDGIDCVVLGDRLAVSTGCKQRLGAEWSLMDCAVDNLTDMHFVPGEHLIESVVVPLGPVQFLTLYVLNFSLGT